MNNESFLEIIEFENQNKHLLKYQQKEQLQTNLDSFEVHFYFFLLIVYFLQKSIKDLKKRKKEIK